MKKIIHVLLLLVLAGCSAAPIETTTQPATIALTQTIEPSAVPTTEPTNTPEPTEDTNSLEYVFHQWLIDPQVVFDEDATTMATNDGGQFGPVSQKIFNSTETVFEFITDDENNGWVPLNTKLDEFGSDRQPGSAQAIAFTFVAPTQTNQLIFDFMGPNEFGVDFQADSKPSVFWFIEATKEAFPGEFSIIAGKTYTILMAIDPDANFRSVIWEEGDYDNKTSFIMDLSTRQNGDGYKNQSWKFIIGFGTADTLKIIKYQILTFDGFQQ